MGSKPPSRSASNMLEKGLVPRIEKLGPELDVDELVEQLRKTHREYQRIKAHPFKMAVERALSQIAPEKAAEVQDAGEGGRTRSGAEAGGGGLPAPGAAGAAPVRGVNNALVKMYQQGNADRASDAPTGEEQQAGTAAREEQAAEPVASGGPVETLEVIEDPAPRPADDAEAVQSTKPVRRKASEAAGDSGRRKRQRTSKGTRATFAAEREPAAVDLEDLGGIDHVIQDIKELIKYPLAHPEVYQHLGVEPPRGVLLHGPPGCGKTALANAIARACGVPFLRISAPEVVSGMSGESEAKLRALFQEAREVAPCIVFIDEIDAIATKRENAQREMERRIVAQMLTCMDDLSSRPARPKEGDEDTAADAPRHVVVMGATNRPDSLDPALRRAGRFDREISLGIPDEAARERILQVLARGLRISGQLDFRQIAKRTPGFVGADLTALIKEAAAIAVRSVFQHLEAGGGPKGDGDEPAQGDAAAAAAGDGEGVGGGQLIGKVLGEEPLTPAQMADISIAMEHFEEALGKVQPSVRREGFTTAPDVSWDDVGSLEDVREELAFAISLPIQRPELFEAMGLPAAAGVLLFGPPGCGKTLVAKAVANDSGANFISIKGPELLNKYVGESERAVRSLFSRARSAAPCVLFFDEMDALAPRRGADGNQSAERVVNQLLTEMDGMDGRQGVFLVAATNRPDMIDPALLRPGRLDKMLYVPVPDAAGRHSILKAACRKMPVAPGVDLGAIARHPRCEGFSGADIAALAREACVAVIKESCAASHQGPQALIEQAHFEQAVLRVQPSVSRKDQREYERLRNRIRAARNKMPDVDKSAAAPDAPTREGDGAGMDTSDDGQGREAGDEKMLVEG
ncbi:unnamed protein product [Pedinophyceae sp. YPF-701]|nr:unnamed protein product [Pedinophyceae sp. YPF-701]